MEIPQNPTNRELALAIDANHQETMREIVFIKEQTTKTNGCVKELKEDVEDMKLWRAEVKGKTWILPLIISAIVAGIIGLFFNHFK